MRLKDKFLPTGPPISSMRSHGRLMNSFAYNICSVEMALMRLNRLAGLSVVMLARKPEAGVRDCSQAPNTFWIAGGCVSLLHIVVAVSLVESAWRGRRWRMARRLPLPH